MLVEVREDVAYKIYQFGVTCPSEYAPFFYNQFLKNIQEFKLSLEMILRKINPRPPLADVK